MLYLTRPLTDGKYGVCPQGLNPKGKLHPPVIIFETKIEANQAIWELNEKHKKEEAENIKTIKQQHLLKP